MEIGVTSGIPMPAARSSDKTKKYPWGDMRVGDSFVYCRWSKARDQAIASSNACLASHRTGFQYATRKVEENGEWVVRVWRIA